MKRSMIKTIAVALATLGFGAARAHAQAAPAAGEYHVVATWNVGGTGGSDYCNVDSEAHRLYIPRGNYVQVIDDTNGKVLGTIPATGGGHGVAFAPKLHLGFTTMAGGVVVFDTNTMKTVGNRKVSGGPDGIFYDSFSDRIVSIGHGGGVLCFIDPNKAVDIPAGVSDPKDIPPATGEPTVVQVGGTLESGASDGAGHVYVDIESDNQVAEVDTKTMKLMGKWAIGDATGPAGLACDPVKHRLFVGCHNNKAAILDSDTGKVLQTLTIGGNVDFTGFNPHTGEGFVSCGDGHLEVLRPTADGSYEVIHVASQRGTSALAVDSGSDTVYMPVRSGGGGRGRRGGGGGRGGPPDAAGAAGADRGAAAGGGGAAPAVAPAATPPATAPAGSFLVVVLKK